MDLVKILDIHLLKSHIEITFLVHYCLLLLQMQLVFTLSHVRDDGTYLVALKILVNGAVFNIFLVYLLHSRQIWVSLKWLNNLLDCCSLRIHLYLYPNFLETILTFLLISQIGPEGPWGYHGDHQIDVGFEYNSVLHLVYHFLVLEFRVWIS